MKIWRWPEEREREDKTKDIWIERFSLCKEGSFSGFLFDPTLSKFIFISESTGHFEETQILLYPHLLSSFSGPQSQIQIFSDNKMQSNIESEIKVDQINIIKHWQFTLLSVFIQYSLFWNATIFEML